MARKNNRTGSREDLHQTTAERQPRHLEPRAGDLPRQAPSLREPTPFFFGAFNDDDEVPPDQPRD